MEKRRDEAFQIDENRGRAYDSLKKEHGGDHGNQYTVEVVSSQVDHSAEPKTVEVVAGSTSCRRRIMGASVKGQAESPAGTL